MLNLINLTAKNINKKKRIRKEKKSIRLIKYLLLIKETNINSLFWKNSKNI